MAAHLKNLSIIDVTEFFDTLIKDYSRLEQSALTLAADLPSLTPEVIRQRCGQLRHDQQLLATLDCRVIDILNLAWEDLAASGCISQYRCAFSATMHAVEAVQKQLLAIRQSLDAVTPGLECRDTTDPA